MRLEGYVRKPAPKKMPSGKGRKMNPRYTQFEDKSAIVNVQGSTLEGFPGRGRNRRRKGMKRFLND